MPDFSQYFDLPLDAVKPIAVGSAGLNPDEAGKALTQGRQYGVPPAVIAADPAGFEDDRRRRDAAAAAERPEIAQYIAADPLHAQVSNDDYDKLDTFSKNWKAAVSGIFAAGSDLGGLPSALSRDRNGQVVPVDNSEYTQSMEWKDVLSPASKLAPKFLYSMGRGSPSLAGGFIGLAGGAAGGTAAGGPIGGAIGGIAGMAVGGGAVAAVQAISPYYRQALQGGKNPDEALNEAIHKASLDGVISGASMALFGWAPFKKNIANILTQATAIQPGAAIAGQVVKNVIAGDPAFQHAGDVIPGAVIGTALNPLMYFSLRGKSIPHGVDETVDTLRVEHAKAANDALDRLMESADATKTKERSPDAFEIYARGHEDQIVSIPAEAVKKLYESYGIQPARGDSLFGFVPDIGDKLSAALDTGDSIQVPLSKYVSQIKADVHEKIKDDVSVGTDGLSRNGIKETEEALKKYRPAQQADDLDARLDQLAKERSSLATEEHDGRANAKVPGESLPLDKALAIATSPGWNFEAAQKAAQWALANNRQDIAQAILDRAFKRAEQTSTTPGVTKDSPRYAKIAEDLAKGKQEATEAANNLAKELGLGRTKNETSNTKKAVAGKDQAAAKAQEEGFEVYHGSAADFEKFDIAKIGTGEGAQSYGHGLYFAENRKVAEEYRTKLALRRPAKSDTGPAGMIARLFDGSPSMTPELAKQALKERLGVNDPPEFVKKIEDAIAILDKGMPGTIYKTKLKGKREDYPDFDTPLKDQPKEIVDKLAKAMVKELGGDYKEQSRLLSELTAPIGEYLKTISRGSHGVVWNKSSEMSEALRKEGLPGLRYKDQYSREDNALLDDLRTRKRELEAYLSDEDFSEGIQALSVKQEKLTEINKEIAELEKNIENPTYNFVAFDDALAQITHKNDQPVAAAVEAVAQTQKRGMYLRPLFADAKAAGLNETDFARYAKRLEASEEDLLTRATKAAERDIRRRQTDEWKKAEADTRAEVETDLQYNPTLMADNYLRTGDSPNSFLSPGYKLDRDYIEAKYGTDSLPKWAVKKGGLHPDELASAFGFNSGEALVNNLKVLEAARKANGEGPGQYLKRRIDEETAKRMEAKHGDLAENIYNEAREAALADVNFDIISDELKALAGLSGGEVPFTVAQLRDSVRGFFDRTQLEHARDAEWFERVVGKEGLKAEQALLKGSAVEAFQAKQRQALAFLMAKEASAFDREMTKGERLFDRAAKNSSLNSIDQPYLDQVHRVLDQIGWGHRRDPEELARGLGEGTLGDFIQKKNEGGWPLAGAEFLLDGTFKANYKDLTAEQFRDIRDTVEQLMHVGKLERTVEITGRRVNYEDAVAKVLTNLDSLEKGFNLREVSTTAAVRSAGRSFDAMMIRMEQMVQWIDKHDPLGVMNSIMFRPLKTAEHWKLEQLKTIAKQFKELSPIKNLRDKLENDTLLDPATGEPMHLDRDALMSIALNMGNESNKQKLLRGWGWDERDVQAFLDKNLTKEDIAYANGVWKILGGLAPKVDEVTRNTTGVGVHLIEAKSRQVANGTLEGGYLPLMEDWLSRINKQRLQKDPLNEKNFLPLPFAQAVKNRTGADYPLALTITELPQRIAETVHYLAFREPLLNALKVASDPQIREGITNAFGPEYTAQLMPWLRHIASDGGLADMSGNEKMIQFSRQARSNVQIMMLGVNLTTAMLHGGSAFFNSMQEVGVRPFLKVILGRGMSKADLEPYVGKFFQNQGQRDGMIAFAMEHSAELRNRKLSLDEDIMKAFERSIGDKSFIGNLQDKMRVNATFLIALSDQASAIPTWKAAYDHEVLKGRSHEDAVYAADQTVRDAHGSSGLTDTAAVQRGQEYQKWFTMFMGYFVHNYNRLRDTARAATETREQYGFNEGDSKTMLIASRTALYLMLPALWHEVLRGSPDKDEGPMGVALDALSSQLAGGVPFLRDLVYSATTRRDVTSPVLDPLRGIRDSFFDLVSATGLSRHKVSPDWVKHTANLPGYTLGLGTKQSSNVAQWLWDLHTGRQPGPQNISEWFRGIMHGKTREKKR